MKNTIRSVARALLLLFLDTNNGDAEREIFTNEDMRDLPPGVVAEVTIVLRHKTEQKEDYNAT